MFQQYMFTHFYNNPAYAGEEGSHVTKYHSRHQWWINDPYAGAGAAFQNHSIWYHTSLEEYNSGVGGLLSYDRTGKIIQNLRGQVAYNYKISFKDQHYLRIGTFVGGHFKAIDTSSLNYGQGTSLNITPTASNFDVGLGGWYRWDGFRLGVGVNHINNHFSPHKSQYWSPPPPLLWILTAGYSFKISTNFTLSPSVHYRAQQSFRSFQITLLGLTWEALYLGASYHLGGTYNLGSSFALIGGYRLGKKFRLSLSWEPPPRFGNIKIGTLEWGAKYQFGEPTQNALSDENIR
jgi:type IX secretion system PorP/SprF family membrane protein